jgi:hypothetical protein
MLAPFFFKAEKEAKNGFTVIVTSQALQHILPKQKHCLVYTLYLLIKHQVGNSLSHIG